MADAPKSPSPDNASFAPEVDAKVAYRRLMPYLKELDELVEQARRIVRGVEPQQLRDNATLRQQVAAQLSGVQATLDGLLVDRPRRRILRSGAVVGAS